jgi:Ca2+-binding EF-hand superfamily protein/CRP-like cAMP-binding protein
MAGGDAYSLPGQTAPESTGAEPQQEKSSLLPPRGRTLAPMAHIAVEPEPEPEQQPAALPTGNMIHVRGIGVDGWDETPDGKGDYENDAALKKLFSPFGQFQQATIRHRIEDSKNTSWALVTMEKPEAIEAILRSHAEAPIFAGSSRLTINRFSQTQAKLSKGGMQTVTEEDKQRRSWPEWLKAASNAYPKMHSEELRSLRDIFDKHASIGVEGASIITRHAMGEILDGAMHDIFDAIDADDSGELERDEVRTLMLMLGRKLNESQLTKVFMELDEDGNGNVDYKEFKTWWDKQEYLEPMERETELRDLFDIVDVDHSGEIDWEEFLELISSQVCRERPTNTSRQKPVDSATLVRTALEAIRADVRAIYGTNSRQVPRLQMLSASEQEAKRKRCFLTPDGTFRKHWDLVQVVMLFYVATMVPLRIGFDEEAKPFQFAFLLEACVDVYFLIDIGVQFRSAYRVDKELVVDTGKIAKRYMKTWFPIDLVSCLPINYVQLVIEQIQEGETSGNSSKAKLFKIFRLLRLAKLLRLARMQRLLDRLKNEYEGLAQFLEMSKITMTIFYVAHFVACFWYLVGDDHEADVVGYTTADSHCNEDNATECLPAGEPLYATFEGAALDSENGGSVLHGWVKRNGWDIDKNNPNLYTRYLDCFYFSVTTLTTVGYGDKTPFTNAEKIFAILCELAGCIIFGIIAGSLSSVAMNETLAQQEIKVQRTRLQEFLKHKKVSSELMGQVISQMDNFFETKSVFDEQDILDRLPPKHRKALLMEMYKTHLKNCPLMKGMEEGVVTKLCLKMRPYLALREDMVVKEGEIGEEMYMIVRGNIKLQSHSWRLYNERSWLDGAFFGELTVLGIGAGKEHNRHVYSATAAINSECIFITQDSMDMLQILHPSFKHKMREMAVKRAERFGYGERAAEHYQVTPTKRGTGDVVMKLDEVLEKRGSSSVNGSGGGGGGGGSGSGEMLGRTFSAVSGPSAGRTSSRSDLRDDLVQGMLAAPPGSSSSSSSSSSSISISSAGRNGNGGANNTPGPGLKLSLESTPEQAARGFGSGDAETQDLALPLLREIVKQNAQLNEQVEYLTAQVDSLVRRSPR